MSLLFIRERLSDGSLVGSQEFYNGRYIRKIGGKPIISRPLLTHKHDNPIMLLYGDGECSLHINEVVDDIIDQWHRSGKKNIRKVCYFIFALYLYNL